MTDYNADEIDADTTAIFCVNTPQRDVFGSGDILVGIIPKSQYFGMSGVNVSNVVIYWTSKDAPTIPAGYVVTNTTVLSSWLM